MNCAGCLHRDRDRLDAQLVQGVPYRSIAASFNLSLGALSRHKRHVKEMIQARTPGEREEHGKSLLARVEELISEAQDVCRLAKADKKYAAARNALNGVGRSLELIGKLTGEIAAPVNAGGIHLMLNKTVNIANYDDDANFARLVFEATRGFDADEIERLKMLAASSPSQP